MALELLVGCDMMHRSEEHWLVGTDAWLPSLASTHFPTSSVREKSVVPLLNLFGRPCV